ncbi:MAG TPA: outer membrane protein transport protein [Kofleriaceae bacterium]|nr:outer membrane protein transport protein [Kofleriaceae bacterium]
MKRGFVVACSLIPFAVSSASAGGLFLPGSGATSTSRAGAAVASADDGEALSINPAGLAKTKGTTITISLALIRYFMEFTRRGTYDDTPFVNPPYEGAPYATIENDPKPPLGIGKFQPIPVIAVVSDLGGRVPNLRVAAGLFAPSGYPFRDMTGGWKFPAAGDPTADLDAPPPPSRYDILTQESRLLLPSIAASYRILPELDVGARFTAGSVQSKSQVAVWGTPFNVTESVSDDSLFTAEVKDGFIPAFGVGVTYRPTPAIEIGANFNSAIVIKAKGTATSVKAPGVSADRVVGPLPDAMAACETGGTFEQQKACISLQLPMNAQVGARYKFIGANEQLRGDIELDVGWENWGKRCALRDNPGAPDDGQFEDLDCTSPGQYRVVLDSGLYVNDEFQQPLEKNYVNYGLKDTFSVRLGGSYHHLLSDGLDANRVILRGGVAYDSTAAKEGWLRAAFDGADRVTSTLGAAFRTSRWELTAGGGFVWEGTSTNPGAAADGSDCNPTSTSVGCAGDGQDRPIDERQGPDPTNPLVNPANQAENPYNQGSFKSHYVLLMLGFTTWF